MRRKHAMPRENGFTRREFLTAAAGGALVAAAGLGGYRLLKPKYPFQEVFIAKAPSYGVDLKEIMLRGFAALGVTEKEIRGKRVLLKPNLVEPHAESAHINTHPLVIQAAAAAFLSLGAAEVAVGEGAGHRRDALLVLEESGLAQVLADDRLPYFDLNTGPVFSTANTTNWSKLPSLTLPQALRRADLVVSVAKMKTHHWAGVTLSMKNLFGVMPGAVYGWPKNVLHWAGVQQCILDITAAVKPDFAIVDGVVGMEGDGPIMGDPVSSGVLVMGRNPVAVDATSARIMGIDPEKIDYLRVADGVLGTIGHERIIQRGEQAAAVRKDYRLIDFIPAQRGIRLDTP